MNNQDMDIPPRHMWFRSPQDFLHKPEYNVDLSSLSAVTEEKRNILKHIQGWYKILLRTKKLEAVCDGIDLATPIYTTMPWNYFVSMMQTKHIYLKHPTDWEDPWENFLLRSDAYLKDGTHCSLKSIADTFYAQCWSLNSESEALWRRYANSGKRAVKIRSTAGKLMAEIYPFESTMAPLQFFLRKVRYVTTEELEEFKRSMSTWHVSSWGEQFLASLCLKRQIFSYEEEVRLIYQDTNSVPGNKKKPSIKPIPANPCQFIEELVVDPWCSDSERMSLSTIVSQWYTGPLQRSQMLDGSDSAVVI